MRRAPVLAFAALLWFAPAVTRAAIEPPPETSCPSAADYTTPDEPLGSLAAAVKAGGPIPVLAIGSATTVGQDGKTNGVSFPYHMVQALHAALPDTEFDLTVKGSRGMSAKDMLSVLDAELAKRSIPLVLWQTGTVEAVRGLGPDSLHATLDAGVRHVRARGGDTVLIDPPFSRALRANTDVEPYERVMHQVAGLPGVLLFPRYDLTRYWVEKGIMDVEKAPLSNRAVAMDELHECVGRALAAFVLEGIRKAAP